MRLNDILLSAGNAHGQHERKRACKNFYFFHLHRFLLSSDKMVISEPPTILLGQTSACAAMEPDRGQKLIRQSIACRRPDAGRFKGASNPD
jgi:hypothetical protein